MNEPLEYKREACVENFRDAKLACEAGADQIELCSCLEEDGLTPTISDIVASLELGIPIKVMIRPRAGGFRYDGMERDKMIQLIHDFKKLGVQHFVMGMLTVHKEVDLLFLERCREQVGDKGTICFHKAIDDSFNLPHCTQTLVESGFVDSILTSGGDITALSGAEMILEMKEICGSTVEVIPAGNINYMNLAEVHERFHLKTYHGRRIVPFTV